MIGNITIFCFAASYTVAFALELTRLLFRSGIRGAVMLGFAGAGLVAHLLYLLHWWIGQGHAPLSSEYDWYLVAALALVGVYLYLTWYHPRNPIGLFTLPLVLALLAAARFAASTTPFAKSQGTALWGLTHGTFMLVGTVAVAVGFVSGAMYLLQAYRLKHKLPPRRGLELPSLEWLDRTSERAIVVSVVMLLGGFGSGLMLSWLKHKAVWWSDPVVWTSSALSAWMAVVALFNFFYKPARHGRKVAYLTVATFLFLAAALVAFLVDPQHGSREPQAMHAAGAPQLSRGPFHGARP